MERPGETFRERLFEIESYLDFLASIEEQAQNGPPSLAGAESPITGQQQRILYSSVYLQLYNLVEATITRCLQAVTVAAMNSGTWQPGDLCGELRREWVRVTARTHADLNYDNRLASAFALCEHLVAALPVEEFTIGAGRGGNWDDVGIEEISKRLGFELRVTSEVYRGVKRPVRDEKGPLALVRDLRNRLAHGAISFTECSEGVTVTELRGLKDKTASYLREVVARFDEYVDGFEYLRPERRPVRAP